MGALHDTTTDEVRIFDEEAVPAELTGDLAQLKQRLAKAASLARFERSTLLGLAGSADTDTDVIARSRDWSQVRPEWGLARNAAFIAAPRHLTVASTSADAPSSTATNTHHKDDGYGVLELILTAPMVVASWINLQYYGSTVNNNAAFGSGNKVRTTWWGSSAFWKAMRATLRTGLPWQSVHDGTRLRT